MANQITRRRDPFFAPIEQLFGRSLLHDPFFAQLGTISEEGSLALDVSEDESSVIVRASLPGYDKSDIHIEVHDGVLTLSAAKTEVHEEKGERFYRKERREGSVSRRVALPVPVVDDQAQAELTDGVLTMRIQKTKANAPKRVKVK